MVRVKSVKQSGMRGTTMPYIKQERRDEIQFGNCLQAAAENAGELNYKLTRIFQNEPDVCKLGFKIENEALNYLNFHGTSYQRINDVIGAVYASYMEYDRRTGNGNALIELVLNEVVDYIYTAIAAPYEDGKIKENGDVY